MHATCVLYMWIQCMAVGNRMQRVESKLKYVHVSIFTTRATKRAKHKSTGFVDQQNSKILCYISPWGGLEHLIESSARYVSCEQLPTKRIFIIIPTCTWLNYKHIHFRLGQCLFVHVHTCTSQSIVMLAWKSPISNLFASESWRWCFRMYPTRSGCT